MTGFELIPESGSAVLFKPEVGDIGSEQLFAQMLGRSGVQSWIDERVNKFAEYVTPKMMYVDGDSMHAVAWVRHQGVIMNDEDREVSYAVHHVVCDCAAESPFPGLNLSNVIDCEVVLSVLDQRAGELATDQRLDETLSALSEFDEKLGDFRLSRLGEELAIRAVAYLLETDKNKPQEWMANKISGLHHINNLASFLRLDTAATMPLLEIMEEGGILTITGDTVKLTGYTQDTYL